MRRTTDTMLVKMKNSGQEVTINVTDYNEELHEKIRVNVSDKGAHPKDPADMPDQGQGNPADGGVEFGELEDPPAKKAKGKK